MKLKMGLGYHNSWDIKDSKIGTRYLATSKLCGQHIPVTVSDVCYCGYRNKTADGKG
jgi:hypothetical protein